jgi:hypothetical protein
MLAGRYGSKRDSAQNSSLILDTKLICVGSTLILRRSLYWASCVGRWRSESKPAVGFAFIVYDNPNP